MHVNLKQMNYNNFWALLCIIGDLSQVTLNRLPIVCSYIRQDVLFVWTTVYEQARPVPIIFSA